MKQVDGQVVGKVKLGQVIAHFAQTLFPLRRSFFDQRIRQPFAALREFRLFAHLLLKAIGGDDAPAVKLLAHAMANVPRQHGILRDLQVNGHDIRYFGE